MLFPSQGQSRLMETPVLCIPLTSEGQIPEELVERVANALAKENHGEYGAANEYYRRFARAALSALLPTETT